jgi:quinol monooxygenase YgiN
MLIAIVDFTVASENRANALAAILAAAPRVRSMPNNIGFDPYLHAVHSGSIRIFHEWEDMASFDAYTSSPEFNGLSQHLRPLMTAQPVSRRMKADFFETIR